MRHYQYPDIGNWYQDLEQLHFFKIVAFDEKEENIEIQYFTGELEELELHTWYGLRLKWIPAPEDSRGPYELTNEELGYSDETIHPENWTGPLSDIEPENPASQ